METGADATDQRFQYVTFQIHLIPLALEHIKLNCSLAVGAYVSDVNFDLLIPSTFNKRRMSVVKL